MQKNIKIKQCSTAKTEFYVAYTVGMGNNL